MKFLTITTTIVFAFGALLIMFEQRGGGELNGLSTMGPNNWIWPQPSRKTTERRTHSPGTRAVGKIEGLTEAVELRSRIAEQISDVHVARGMWVSTGDVLISLDADHLLQERDLAAALLDLAIAKKTRLEKGARTSEIEAAKKDYESNLAPLWSAERALQRGTSLFEKNAISQQAIDELQANKISMRAKVAAAKARLTTLELPARLDEIAAADATIRAAESRLKIAAIKLDRSLVKAPMNGQVLQVNAEVGELTGPGSAEPMIVMVDTSILHVLAEVDEFDALRVEVGQDCEITSDAHEGILAIGRIVEIEPQMLPKKSFGQWAGERNDTFSRRVRIALEGSAKLPIGLPVEVTINVDGDTQQ